jgi:hypothetical protein
MQSNNPWLNFVHKFHKQQNHLTYKEALQQAKLPYRKYQQQRGGGGNNGNNGNNGSKSKSKNCNNGTVLDKKRIPSYCDRIIYRSNDGSLLFSEPYTVIKDDFINFSDHKMISTTFSHAKSTYKLFSWNMGAFDTKDMCENSLTQQIYNFCEKHIGTFAGDYVIFGLQESVLKSYFVAMLKKFIPMFSFTLVNAFNTTPRLLNKKFIIQHLVFKRTQKTNNGGTAATMMGSSDTDTDAIMGQSGFSYKSGKGSYIGHTKSYVYWAKNDLTIVVTHLPINPKDQKEQGVLGVDWRRKALTEIINRFRSSPQLVIMGDLNFRRELPEHTAGILGKNQLTKLLEEEFRGFYEPGGVPPDMFTCRYQECHSTYPFCPLPDTLPSITVGNSNTNTKSMSNITENSNARSNIRSMMNARSIRSSNILFDEDGDVYV